ncbi:hypothetical protein [Psychrobacter frigidicola]|uniref:hypothetical protein n=1 Tax=Psychrobacter frigidicola TaxID=45611 RepID=UPI00191A3968|nr:hypothetical protein [Psychrobacter frigidicola]
MNNSELKNMTSILEYCRCLNSKITTVLLKEGLSNRDFESNMRIIAFNIDNEQISLQAIIYNLPDDKGGK